MDESTAPSQSKELTRLIILVLVVAIISAFLGYLAGQKVGLAQNFQIQKGEVVVPQTAENGASSIIVNQSATAVGKVIKVENGSVTLQSDNGIVMGFKVAPRFNIYNAANASASGTPKTSQDLKDVELNQKYILDLILEKGSYLVTTMNKVAK